MAALAAIICLIPMFLVLASFVGVAPYSFNMLLVAVPVAGIGIVLAIVGWSALGDLLLPTPVLSIDEDGIWDRRVSDGPIAWTDVTAATSLLSRHGGVVLELKSSTPTALDPFRPGTFMYERPEPGVAHIPVRAMTVPAQTLVEAILTEAQRAGATVGSAESHEKMPRRRWFGRM
jgi:hypothetical protein